MKSQFIWINLGI